MTNRTALDVLDALGVYTPSAGRYYTDAPCTEPVDVDAGTRECGSHVVNAITGRCAARDAHREQ